MLWNKNPAKSYDHMFLFLPEMELQAKFALYIMQDVPLAQNACRVWV